MLDASIKPDKASAETPYETIFSDKRMESHATPPTGVERRQRNQANGFGNHWYLSTESALEEIDELTPEIKQKMSRDK